MTSTTAKLRAPLGATYSFLPFSRSPRWLELVSVSARVRRFLRERSVGGLQPFAALKAQCHAKLWAAAAAAVGATIDDLGHQVYRIARDGRETFVSSSRVMLDGPVTLKMAGNKPLVSRLLGEHGYPVGRFVEFDLTTIARAEKFLEELGGPVVVKPAESGASGNGITTGIETRRELWQAALFASTYSRALLAEPHVGGLSYRLLYLDGGFLDAVERRPPHITGDGRHSVARLIRQENRRRLEGVAPLGLQPLVVNLELKRGLTRQGLTMSSVLAAGQRLTLKSVVNDNTAADNSNVRDRVHPDTIQRGADIARLLRVRLAGLDVITTDISRPLAETGGVVNEVNTMPGLLHHYLLDRPEEGTPVMERLLEVLLDRKEWPQS